MIYRNQIFNGLDSILHHSKTKPLAPKLIKSTEYLINMVSSYDLPDSEILSCLRHLAILVAERESYVSLTLHLAEHRLQMTDSVRDELIEAVLELAQLRLSPTEINSQTLSPEFRVRTRVGNPAS